jgi:hypothetical protein
MSISALDGSRTDGAVDNAETISGLVHDHLTTAVASVGNWVTTFPEAALAQLGQPTSQQEVGRLAFIDGYHRIRQTSPLILAAIQTLDRRLDHDNSRFWVHHLAEEYGHDAAMRRDIVAMIGDESEATRILDATAITPPSAAMIGFFDWQVRHGNPHLLVVLRLFLETVMAELDDGQAAAVHELFPGGSEVIRLHRDADHDHVGECYDYVDRNFAESDLPTLIWAVDFIALCLNEGNSWICAQVLGRASS